MEETQIISSNETFSQKTHLSSDFEEFSDQKCFQHFFASANDTQTPEAQHDEAMENRQTNMASEKTGDSEMSVGGGGEKEVSAVNQEDTDPKKRGKKHKSKSHKKATSRDAESEREGLSFDYFR